MSWQTITKENNLAISVVPVNDFALHKINQPIHRRGPAIVLALKGTMEINGEIFPSGSAVFIPHGQPSTLAPASGSEIYSCSTPEDFNPPD
jgi:mannose-6-phosphate isomerase class I